MSQKYYFLALFFMLIGFNVVAQSEKSSYFISTGLLLNEMPKTIRVASVTDFGLSKNNNLYKIGIIAQLYTDNAESKSESPKLTGGHLGYGKIIPTSKKWLALELKSDLNLQYFKSVWLSNTFNENLQHYAEYEYKLGESLFDLSLGYGLRANISPRFYISQSFTGGVFYSRINSDEISLNAPEVTDADFDFRSYGNTGFQWNFMLTFGYSF